MGPRSPKEIDELVAELHAKHYASVTEAWDGPQLHYMPWYVADFNGNGIVGAMTDRQELWYRRLLERSWQMPQPCFLPNDLGFLAQLCRCTPLDLQADGLIVLARFQTTADKKHIFHPRLLREYLPLAKKYLKQSAAGKKTAGRNKSGQLSTQLSTALPTPEAGHNQNHNHVEIPTYSAPAEDDVTVRLEHFSPDDHIPKLLQTHPRPERGHAFQVAYMETIEGEVRTARRTRSAVASEIQQRARLYREMWERGQISKKNLYGLTNWLAKGIWKQEPEVWSDGAVEQTGSETRPRTFAATAGAARTSNNLAAAARVIQRTESARQAQQDRGGPGAPLGADESDRE